MPLLWRPALRPAFRQRCCAATQPLRALSCRSRRSVTTAAAATCVVFDKDGTLLDAHKTWAPVIRAACAAMPEDDQRLFDLLGEDFYTQTDGFCATNDGFCAENSVLF